MSFPAEGYLSATTNLCVRHSNLWVKIQGPRRVSEYCVNICSSELQLKRELDGTRSANLIERIEATINATARAQAVRQCLRRTAEQGTGQEVDGTAEVRMVRDVEELRLEAQSDLLSD